MGKQGQGCVKEGLYHQRKGIYFEKKIFSKRLEYLCEKHLARIQFDA
jgi:hypothetical protein